MILAEYDGKYVRIIDTDGNTLSGRAKYGNTEFLECEWGLDEDGVFIGLTIQNTGGKDDFLKERLQPGSASEGDGRAACDKWGTD